MAKSKPIKAWAVIKNGELVTRWMFPSRAAAERWLVFRADDEAIVPAEITVKRK